MLAQLSLDLWTKIQLISPNQSTTPHTHRIMGGASMPKVSILLQNLNTQKNLNKRGKMHIKNNLCVWKNRSTSENFAGTGPQEGGGVQHEPLGKKEGKIQKCEIENSRGNIHTQKGRNLRGNPAKQKTNIFFKTMRRFSPKRWLCKRNCGAKYILVPSNHVKPC